MGAKMCFNASDLTLHQCCFQIHLLNFLEYDSKVDSILSSKEENWKFSY